MKAPNPDQYWWLYGIGLLLVCYFWRVLVILAIVAFALVVEYQILSDRTSTLGIKATAGLIVAALAAGLCGWIKQGSSATQAARPSDSDYRPLRPARCSVCNGTQSVPCRSCYSYAPKTCQMCYGSGSVRCTSC